jgi:hypothetical protein
MARQLWEETLRKKDMVIIAGHGDSDGRVDSAEPIQRDSAWIVTAFARRDCAGPHAAAVPHREHVSEVDITVPPDRARATR